MGEGGGGRETHVWWYGPVFLAVPVDQNLLWRDALEAGAYSMGHAEAFFDDRSLTPFVSDC